MRRVAFNGFFVLYFLLTYIRNPQDPRHLFSADSVHTVHVHMLSVAWRPWLRVTKLATTTQEGMGWITDWIPRSKGKCCWVSSTELKVTFISIDWCWTIFWLDRDHLVSCLFVLSRASQQVEIAWCWGVLDGSRNNTTLLVPGGMVFKRLFWDFMLFQSIIGT